MDPGERQTRSREDKEALSITSVVVSTRVRLDAIEGHGETEGQANEEKREGRKAD